MTQDKLDVLADSCWEEHNGLNTFNHVKFAALVAAPVRTKDLTDDELDVFFNMYWQGKDDADVDLIEVFRAVIAADREKNKCQH